MWQPLPTEPAHSDAIAQALAALHSKIESLERQNKYYADSITMLTAEMGSCGKQQAVASTQESRQLEQLEGVIQDERQRVQQYHSDMQLLRKDANDRSTILMQEKEEMASKLSTQRARAHGLHSELDREKAHRVQEETERDAARAKLARLEKERESWRHDAVVRVQTLEQKHIELTARRNNSEVLTNKLQGQLNEERHARTRAENGLDKSRALLEKALMLNQQLVAKLKGGPKAGDKKTKGKKMKKR